MTKKAPKKAAVRRRRRPSFKGFNPGDAVEIVWRDATTHSAWMSAEAAAKADLAIVLSRGTLISVRKDAVVIAMDAGLRRDGTIADTHGPGVIEINSIAEIYKLERAGAREAKPRG